MGFSQTDAPLVTVGIPTYIRPAGLRRTIDCITAQSYRNLEILVSDNASPGGETEAIVREYQARDARITYFRQPTNLGIEGNFKFLLERASGPLFLWAADDDEWTPDFIDVCLARLGDAGSAMTAMRVAVRTRGLSRPKPPLSLTPAAGPFANAVAFVTNFQPSLFYGLHRTDSLRACLKERIYDYYDCFFILRQILTHGFVTDPKECFHVGVDSEQETYKPARPESGVVYRYSPFYGDAIRTVLRCGKLSLMQKARLFYLLSYFTLNEFVYFERDARPRQVKVGHALLAALRPLRHLFRVPLPNPPPTMLMPADPAEVPFMQLPAAELRDEAGVRKHLDETLGHLWAKLSALHGLRAVVDDLRPIGTRGADLPPLALPADEGPDLLALRRRLGLALLMMEEGEARIQALLRERDALTAKRSRAA